MPLDSQTQAILDQAKESGAPALHELPVEEARAALKEMSRTLDVEKFEIRDVQDRTIQGPAGDIPIRIYWPDTTDSKGSLPILMLYHGGGFALGDIDTHDHMARHYCKHGEVIVISVDYRLAPEHPFPAGIEDCYAALCWASENANEIGGNNSHLAVTGDSAGGNISAVICQLAKERKGPAIAFQALVYPCATMETKTKYASRETFGSGDYFLGQKDIEWLNSMYFADPDDATSTAAAPIHAADLSGLPQALVITAGFDPLSDEGEDYANRLKEAGVQAEHVRFEGTIHGFMSFAGAIDAGRKGLALVSSRLKEVLG